MKVNKAIYLSFNGVNQDSASINVNFPVKSVHVKSACLTSLSAITAGDEIYFTLVSDLTNGEPLAQLYNNSAYSASQFCDVSFQPYRPVNVNGDYTFTLYRPTGIIATPATTSCLISMILEFNGEDTPNH
jgi:hypothetical protein